MKYTVLSKAGVPRSRRWSSAMQRRRNEPARRADSRPTEDGPAAMEESAVPDQKRARLTPLREQVRKAAAWAG